MKKTILLAVAVLLLFASPVFAHYLWLNVENQAPKTGESVTVKLGWGHRFPGGEKMHAGMFRRILAVDSEGNHFALTPVSEVEYRFLPRQSGLYRLYADIHPGFVSKTTGGYKLQPKNKVEEPLTCFRYDIRAGTRIRVGKGSQSGAAFTENPMEVAPLADTTRLKAGDKLPVKVLFNGVPLAGARIDATYAGFSDEADVFVASVETGRDGTANVVITEKGLWLVSATYEPPYPDPAVCDIYRYKFSLTFVVE